MIFYAMSGEAAALPVARAVAEHAMTSPLYRGTAADGPPVEISVSGCEGDQAEINFVVTDELPDFHWSDEETMREYIRLEQKMLAKQASQEDMASP